MAASLFGGQVIIGRGSFFLLVKDIINGIDKLIKQIILGLKAYRDQQYDLPSSSS